MLDERITLRTEEYVCPTTGETKVRTVEYIEKVIEKEVRVDTHCKLCYIVLRDAVHKQCRIVCGFIYIFVFYNTLSLCAIGRSRLDTTIQRQLFRLNYDFWIQQT